MRVIGYQKTDEGVVVVEDKEVKKKPAETVVDRYNELFNSVPLHGGREWESLTIQELVSVHVDAAKALVKHWRKQHDTAVKEFGSRHCLVRWYKKVRGWEAPETPSETEIVVEMVARLRDLADWMAANQYRPFYAGSDMNHFVTKPRAVAKVLEEQYK